MTSAQIMDRSKAAAAARDFAVRLTRRQMRSEVVDFALCRELTSRSFRREEAAVLFARFGVERRRLESVQIGTLRDVLRELTR